MATRLCRIQFEGGVVLGSAGLVPGDHPEIAAQTLPSVPVFGLSGPARADQPDATTATSTHRERMRENRMQGVRYGAAGSRRPRRVVVRPRPGNRHDQARPTYRCC